MKTVRLFALGSVALGATVYALSTPESPAAVSETPAVEDSTEIAPVATIVDTPDRQSEWRPPFPGKAELFTAPEQNAPVASVVSGTDSKAVQIRVIGFVNVEGREPAAILGLGDRLTIVSAGESIADMEVVSINGQNVTMKRHDRLWSVSLFDSINEPVSIASAERQLGNPHPVDLRSGGDGPVSRIAPDTAAGFDAVPLLPDVPSVTDPPPVGHAAASFGVQRSADR